MMIYRIVPYWGTFSVTLLFIKGKAFQFGYSLGAWVRPPLAHFPLSLLGRENRARGGEDEAQQHLGIIFGLET